MWLTIRKHGILYILLMSLLTGCGRSAVRQPQDPLLISKKPIEGKPQQSDPAALAYHEPGAPQLDESAFASAPPSSGYARFDPERTRYRADLVTFGKPVPASQFQTAQRTTEPGASKTVDAFPAIRNTPRMGGSLASHERRVSGAYGRNGDYTWLQGTLDKHFRGHYTLRYCPATEEDAWGGKVHLEDDPRLGGFQEGDVVAVEGDFVRENGKVALGAWNHYPRFRIRSIQLIQRKATPQELRY